MDKVMKIELKTDFEKVFPLEDFIQYTLLNKINIITNIIKPVLLQAEKFKGAFNQL
jgi:hypothetical protein